MKTLQVEVVGDKKALILPDEMLAKLNLKNGSSKVCLVETTAGFELSPWSEELEADLQAVDSIMRRYHNALRELAK